MGRRHLIKVANFQMFFIPPTTESVIVADYLQRVILGVFFAPKYNELRWMVPHKWPLIKRDLFDAIEAELKA
jgi:hypothetical protein